nr:hypothetical protein [Butyrivibrio sp.]
MRKRMLLLTLSAVTAMTMSGCTGKKNEETATTKPAVTADTAQVNTEKKEEDVEITTVTIKEDEEEESTEATSEEEKDEYIEDHFADLYINGAQFKIDFNGSHLFSPTLYSPTLDEICERSGLVVQTDTIPFIYPYYFDA